MSTHLNARSAIARMRGLAAATAASLAATITLPVFAAVPTPPAPSTGPDNSDAIGYFEGVFEDASEVGILIIGIALFVMGAAGMVWSVAQVMGGRETIAGVGKIGVASAAGIAFGTYALTQATAII